jgi:hypothetical protein
MAVRAAGGERRSGDWPPKVSLVRGANREIGVPGEEKGRTGVRPFANCCARRETLCGAEAPRRLPPGVNKAETPGGDQRCVEAIEAEKRGSEQP